MDKGKHRKTGKDESQVVAASEGWGESGTMSHFLRGGRKTSQRVGRKQKRGRRFRVRQKTARETRSEAQSSKLLIVKRKTNTR